MLKIQDKSLNSNKQGDKLWIMIMSSNDNSLGIPKGMPSILTLTWLCMNTVDLEFFCDILPGNDTNLKEISNDVYKIWNVMIKRYNYRLLICLMEDKVYLLIIGEFDLHMLVCLHLVSLHILMEGYQLWQNNTV